MEMMKQPQKNRGSLLKILAQEGIEIVQVSVVSPDHCLLTNWICQNVIHWLNVFNKINCHRWSSFDPFTLQILQCQALMRFGKIVVSDDYICLHPQYLFYFSKAEGFPGKLSRLELFFCVYRWLKQNELNSLKLKKQPWSNEIGKSWLWTKPKAGQRYNMWPL